MSIGVAAVIGALGGWAAWLAAARVLAERNEEIPPFPGWTRPVTALVTAGLCAGAAAVVGVEGVLPAYLWFVLATMTLFLTDLRAQLIPDRISGPATTVGALLLMAGSVVDAEVDRLPRAGFAAIAYLTLLFAIYVLGRGRSFGGGDVKLAPLLGLFTGYLGWEHFLSAIVLGFLLGGLVAVVLVVFRLRSLRDHFAFGPVLILGAYASIAWGEPLVKWYTG